MINNVEYKTITDKIHELQDVLLNTSSVSIDMQVTSSSLSLAFIGANPLINFENTANEVDYFSDINSTLRGFEKSGSDMTAGDHLDNLVEALQKHILARYDTIDDWLLEQSILVKQRFFDISNRLGYEISGTYLE